MRCMCPRCGKKHESSKLVFDFKEFLREKIQVVIDGCDGEPDQKKRWKQGCEAFFNSEDLFVPEEEGRLWNLPLAAEDDSNPAQRYVQYRISVSRLLQLARETGAQAEGSAEAAFIQWLSSNETYLESLPFVLFLQKTGSGDIHFNRIHDPQNNNHLVSKVRCCPNPRCHQPMSFFAGRYIEWTLTVLGGKRVSKSTTLTACADQFMKVTSNIRWRGSEEDEGYQNFKQIYLETYRNGIRIDATDTTVDNIPRVSFEISFKGREEKICLTFVDLPGEFNGQAGVGDRVYELYTDFYKNVDFIWYCTDPAEVTQTGTPQTLQNLGYGAGGKVVDIDQLAENMRVLSAFFQRANRVIPVMYILGKSDSDVISEADKERYGLFDAYQENREWEYLDVHAFFDQAMNVRKYISAKNPEMIRVFEEQFRDRSYAAVSAYGCTPRESEKDPEISMAPFNCRLPFYWMLALRNCLPVRTAVYRRGWGGALKPTGEETIMLSTFSDEEKRAILDNLLTHDDNYTYCLAR